MGCLSRVLVSLREPREGLARGPWREAPRGLARVSRGGHCGEGAAWLKSRLLTQYMVAEDGQRCVGKLGASPMQLGQKKGCHM